MERKGYHIKYKITKWSWLCVIILIWALFLLPPVSGALALMGNEDVFYIHPLLLWQLQWHAACCCILYYILAEYKEIRLKDHHEKSFLLGSLPSMTCNKAWYYFSWISKNISLSSCFILSLLFYLLATFLSFFSVCRWKNKTCDFYIYHHRTYIRILFI